MNPLTDEGVLLLVVVLREAPDEGRVVAGTLVVVYLEAASVQSPRELRQLQSVNSLPYELLLLQRLLVVIIVVFGSGEVVVQVAVDQRAKERERERSPIPSYGG